MINFALIMMKLHLIIILLCFCLSLAAYNDHRNVRVDSLEKALKSSTPPQGENLLRAYDELMRGYLPYDAQKTEYYGRKALALSYELDAYSIRQYVLRHFGLLHYGREDFDTALAYFDQALAVADTMEQCGRYTQSDLDDARSALYGSIANVYNLQGKAHLAIHYYQLAQPIFERNGWLESQAVLYLNVGELYATMGNDDEAEHNYLQAVAKGRQAGDSLMMAMPRKGLAKVYLQRNDYQQAQHTLRQCLDYYSAHRSQEPSDYAEVLASMAQLHLMQAHEDLAAANRYAHEAAELVTEEMMFETQSDIYKACCQVAMAQGQWTKALDYGLRTIRPDSLATDADAEGYQLLAEIYMEMGQKQKARQMMHTAHRLMSRFATEHYQSGLSQMAVLYETEKKEAQIAALAHERRLYGGLLLGAAVLVVLLAALLVYRHQAHKRQKALLAAEVALQTETNERHILARELHDSLGGMLSLLRIKMENHDADALQQLDNTVVQLRRVSHHLMPEELLRGGLVSALHDFAVSIPGAHFQAFGTAQLSKERELVLYRCAYELVNNALKHAHASHIDLQLMLDDQQATLTVSDDGQGGCPVSQDVSHPEGMGLQNIRERIAPYRGQLTIVSNEGRGTETNIILPL